MRGYKCYYKLAFLLQPIRNPPSEKRFYRCICHCLLLVPRHQNIFVCPRTSCRTVLVTEVAKKNPQLISNFLDEHFESLKRPASLPDFPSLPDRDSTKTKGVVSRLCDVIQARQNIRLALVSLSLHPFYILELSEQRLAWISLPVWQSFHQRVT